MPFFVREALHGKYKLFLYFVCKKNSKQIFKKKYVKVDVSHNKKASMQRLCTEFSLFKQIENLLDLFCLEQSK